MGRKKLQVENQDLTRQIDEVEAAIGTMAKNKISLGTQLEDTKRLGDSEARDRAALQALSKSNAEIQLWKSKFETEGMGRIDELEGGKQKLSAALSQAEETIETLNQKVSSTEKNKHRLETELEDLQFQT